ncbi:MAG: acetamidase/formamidase family protein, partial [Acetobacteraceae bacterium]|nr:acetamidase/formamidase family protein [Acetobacteraceae bacterium]
MPKTAFQVDLAKPPESAPIKTMNRWHPDIPMVETFKPGAEFRVECFDWTGGQIHDSDTANDIRDVNLTKVHYLSGPFGVEGAEPGDLLVVDLLDIGYLPDSPWGFTGIFAKENGGGFLVDHYPEAKKAIWKFHGMYTDSRHVPGVRWPGIIHPGLIGCLPDRKLLDTANKREAELIATNPERVPPLAAPPFAETALMGQMTGREAQDAAKEAWRTVPPREHGGNCDIKNLS